MSETHDFQRGRWGWHIEILRSKDGGHRLDLAGHGRGIQTGDAVILRDEDNGGSRYRIDSIRYMSDPTDQFFANASFWPRAAEEKHP